MPFVPVPATIKCSFFYTYQGQQTMNRIHVSHPASFPSEADCQAVANTAAAWWTGNVQSIVTNTLALRQIQATSIAEPNGPQATFSAGLPASGASTSPPLPNNVAFCVSLRSGLAGRSARGRWYWQGLTEEQVAGNIVAGGVVLSIVAAMDNLISTLSGGGAQTVIVSYNANGVPRPGGPVKFIITDALAVDDVIDSQRRRLPGRGN